MKIKVRVWHKKLNEYVKPSRYLVIDEFGELFNDECVIQQFTGLKDINGKDIYEGDIVYLSGYGKCTCEFPFTELYEAYQENDIGEILGKIHENPKLME